MNITRRTFLKKSSQAAGVLALGTMLTEHSFGSDHFDFKISLAQWSLHKGFQTKKLNPLDFPVIARKQFNIDAVEYVNQFFLDKAKDQTFLKELKQRCNDHGVKSNLIMVDLEGSLGDNSASEGQKSVENHYKWVDAAAFLECTSIRVNLHGTGTAEQWKTSSIKNLHTLAQHAQKQHIHVIVENHGGYSSNGKLLSEVIKAVNLPNCGTLPDFGNFCMRREKGDLYESPCVEYYDKYLGVKEMLPFAKGVSAKTFDFDAAGNETTIDYLKMFRMIKETKFSGYVGIEYEGNTLSEEEGIKATLKLLQKVKKELA